MITKTIGRSLAFSEKRRGKYIICQFMTAYSVICMTMI